MNKKPIIGITPNIEDGKLTLDSRYLDAIFLSGGVPIILPRSTKPDVIDKYLESCDGFVFSGGGDLDPAYYGEPPSDKLGRITEERDSYELELAKRVLETDKPVLGICRGTQVINVALGGTLYQDIPTEIDGAIDHRQTDTTVPYTHGISVLPGTPLYEIVGGSYAMVNTFHHQAVKVLGDGLEIMARAEDGVIEALYSPKRRFLYLIQWHPERMVRVDECTKRLLERFIEEAAK